MKLFTLIIILVVATVILIVGLSLYMAVGKIKSLEKAKTNLKDDNSKLSDALRRKGIQVDRLLREIKRLENK